MTSKMKRWTEMVERSKRLREKVKVNVEEVNVEEPFKCKGKTKAGKDCKNEPVENSEYCRLHQGDDEDAI